MSKEWIVKAMEMAFQEDKGLWADSLLDAIKGLSSEQANWKPDKGDIHSISEIVNHIISGKKWILSLLEGKKPAYEEESKKSVTWEDTIKELKDVHEKVIKLLKEKDIDLDAKVPEEESTWGEMLFGVLAHDCYHLGQIIILKGLQEL
ncbi:MAG: DinB family protein [bacterium]|nr:DinB family protein [bacterium]